MPEYFKNKFVSCPSQPSCLEGFMLKYLFGILFGIAFENKGLDYRTLSSSSCPSWIPWMALIRICYDLVDLPHTEYVSVHIHFSNNYFRCSSSGVWLLIIITVTSRTYLEQTANEQNSHQWCETVVGMEYHFLVKSRTQQSQQKMKNIFHFPAIGQYFL